MDMKRTGSTHARDSPMPLIWAFPDEKKRPVYVEEHRDVESYDQPCTNVVQLLPEHRSCDE